MRSATLIFGWLAWASAAHAQRIETGFLDRSVSIDGQEYLYQVYVPREYDASREWPVILFLHGAGERGSDGLAQTQVGLGAAIRSTPERWPAITVFPQVPEDMTWQATPGLMAIAALEATEAEYRTDPGRVYWTGLSLGGNGTWYLAYQHPARFAALVAICAFIDAFPGPSFTPSSVEDPHTEVANRIAELPIWIVHGDADPVVPVEQSRRMAAALRELGAAITYVELPGVRHNAWDPGYADEALPSWLFAQSRR